MARLSMMVIVAFVVAIAPAARAAEFAYGIATPPPEGIAVCSIRGTVKNTGFQSQLLLTLTPTSGEALTTVGVRYKDTEITLAGGTQAGCDIFPATPQAAVLELPEAKKVTFDGALRVHAHPGSDCASEGRAEGTIGVELVGGGALGKVKVRCSTDTTKANVRLDLLASWPGTRGEVLSQHVQVTNLGPEDPATRCRFRRKRTKGARVVRFECGGQPLVRPPGRVTGGHSFVVLDGDVQCDLGNLPLYQTVDIAIDVVPLKAGTLTSTYDVDTEHRGPLFGKIAKDSAPVAAGASAILTVDVRCKGAAGTVTIQPNASGGTTTCTCPDPTTNSDKVTCIEIYGAKTEVTLTANATSGKFDKWSGECSGGQADCKITMDPSAQNPDKSAKAKFKP